MRKIISVIYGRTYKKSEEAKVFYKNLNAIVDSIMINVPVDSEDENIYNAIAEVGKQSHKEGFTCGFGYAIKLLCECVV